MGKATVAKKGAPNLYAESLYLLRAIYKVDGALRVMSLQHLFEVLRASDDNCRAIEELTCLLMGIHRLREKGLLPKYKAPHATYLSKPQK